MNVAGERLVADDEDIVDVEEHDRDEADAVDEDGLDEHAVVERRDDHVEVANEEGVDQFVQQPTGRWVTVEVLAHTAEAVAGLERQRIAVFRVEVRAEARRVGDVVRVRGRAEQVRLGDVRLVVIPREDCGEREDEKDRGEHACRRVRFRPTWRRTAVANPAAFALAVALDDRDHHRPLDDGVVRHRGAVDALDGDKVVVERVRKVEALGVHRCDPLGGVGTSHRVDKRARGGAAHRRRRRRAGRRRGVGRASGRR